MTTKACPHDLPRISIPLDERGMPVVSAELKAQITPLLNLNALHKALAKAAQTALTKDETAHDAA